MTTFPLPINGADADAKTMPIAAKEELFIIAGEASGDLIGSLLVKSLRRELPKLPLVGIGGPLMSKAGMVPLGYYDNLQVMGVWEVIKNLPFILKTLQKVTNEILIRQPKGVIFVDFPGFNLKLAKKLRKNGYKGKLFQFVSPSVWAWKKWRTKTLVDTLDILFSIFPFEKEHFANTPLQVEYVGHPLQEILQQTPYDSHFDERFGLAPERPVLAVFPGSRKGEINRHLPLIVPILEKFLSLHPEYQIAFSVGNENFSKLIQKQIPDHLKSAFIPSSHTYDLMKRAHVALAKSGTVTLELAWHQVPTAVFYKLSSFDHFLAKWLFNLDLPYYCMVNILKGKTVYPEWIKEGLPVDGVVASLEELVGPKGAEVKKMCEAVWDDLSPPGHLPPSQLAAKKIRQAF